MKLIWSLSHCECDGHTAHKLCQRRLTAEWLAPRESDCSRMHSKVSSDWLPSYVKAKRPDLEIFKMAGYFRDSSRTPYYCYAENSKTNWTNSLAIKVSLTAYGWGGRFLWNVGKHLPNTPQNNLHVPSNADQYSDVQITVWTIRTHTKPVMNIRWPHPLFLSIHSIHLPWLT